VTGGDTICAISSAAGPAGRTIVRVSGPEAVALAAATAEPVREMAGGEARRLTLHLAGMLVPAWVYVFRGPRSYTGEDIVELHLPGNAILARMVLDDLIRRGARPAEAGEFTARAYFNRRMDLTEAEGVAAAVSAGSERELIAARQLLAGELARRLSPMMDQLADTLALVEVGIDFTDEDVTFLSTDELLARIVAIHADLRRLVRDSARFERLSHEPRVVLVGRPNAGKSTLMNALSRSARAIVSPQAGTTRDVLSAEVELASGLVTLLDVAGLETDENGQTPEGVLAEVHQQMQRRAREAVAQADLVVLVREISDRSPPIDIGRSADLSVWTKLDLAGAAGDLPAMRGDAVAVSAVTGAGMEELRRRLDELAFGKGGQEATLALNTRHLAEIDAALAALDRATKAADEGAELAALELREALDALGRILGAVTPDELLGRIFSRFCIGK